MPLRLFCAKLCSQLLETSCILMLYAKRGKKMVLLGALVNGLGILVGSVIGIKLHNIPERMKDTVMKGMGLSVIVLGIQMAFKTSNSLIVILSICFGAVIGE